jgi:3'(2'), 5'-bisphosphate nucleotidase
MMNLNPILDAVRRASLLCREVQKSHIIENAKAFSEPVTIADYGSQAIINRAIRAAFPQDSIMAEENGAQFMALVSDEQKQMIAQLVSVALGQAVTVTEIATWLDYANYSGHEGRVWVIDPIDGTKGFLAHRHYCVAVGILEDGQPNAAVMGCPAYPGFEGGALFSAQDGAAYRMPLMDASAAPQAVRVSERVAPHEVRVLESVEKSHVGHERMARVQQLAGYGDSPVERVDSQEKYARIAAGDGELYLRLPRVNSTRGHSTWDHAAGAALLYAAGGTVTDIDGTPLDFTTGRELSNNQGMIVSNGRFHDKILDAVRIVLNEEARARGE